MKLTDGELAHFLAEETGKQDVVTVIATHPLTLDEPWVKMSAGEWALFHHGERLC